ncbi:MAG: diphosphate--fructose-6-phosphate 1-phosphotransferase [Spirochaetes bacterium]|nr:diphosphate--fructose-6-phosphate 1-phosphotransferase [Spirochaetota bacterium]
MESISTFQKLRYTYKPKLPKALSGDISNILPEAGIGTEPIDNKAEIKSIFENTCGMPIITFKEGKNKNTDKINNIGVVLSGGQAPGGHNVIAGIFDCLKKSNKNSKLFGFLGGPSGITDDKVIEITDKFMDDYRNTGGFDIIGSGRTKLEKEEQFDKCIEVCKKRSINAIVIIGGDDSNTNAALLAEYFKKKNSDVQIIGVPKTIDGDLKNNMVEVSFGFDTATKTYSELIGNICRDAKSAKKYWHFIKLMGRSASHICLECALKTQPNFAIISEEVSENQQSLNQIVEDIVKVIVARANNRENFGIVLVPEGLIEYIPEINKLITELNNILAENEKYFSTLRTFEDQSEWINKNLTKDASYTFSSLPNDIQRQLLMDRDPHGNVQVSRIETEKLLIDLIDSRLNEMKSNDQFKGIFATQHHFLGYEGRCAFPSNFDADYAYSLGFTASLLIINGFSGYMACVKNLSKSSEEWISHGIPLTMMMNMELRHGKMKPVIKKALVDLEGKPFKMFKNKREKWAIQTSYTYPGAIQYFGPDEICNMATKTIILEQE